MTWLLAAILLTVVVVLVQTLSVKHQLWRMENYLDVIEHRLILLEQDVWARLRKEGVPHEEIREIHDIIPRFKASEKFINDAIRKARQKA